MTKEELKRKAYQRAYYLENEGKMRRRQGGEKTCLECKETFKGRGNQPRCSECQRIKYKKSNVARGKKYHENNGEKIAAAKKKYRKTKHGRETEAVSSKKWREKNKGKCREDFRKWVREMSPEQRVKSLQGRRDWYQRNRKKADTLTKKWAAKNKDKVRGYAQKHRDENKGKYAAYRMNRIAIQKSATLPDTDLGAIRDIYRECNEKTKRCKRDYHVDHIIPLSKGGAHHQDNLRIITAHQNLVKWNKFDPTLRGRWANNNLARKNKGQKCLALNPEIK